MSLGQKTVIPQKVHDHNPTEHDFTIIRFKFFFNIIGH